MIYLFLACFAIQAVCLVVNLNNYHRNLYWRRRLMVWWAGAMVAWCVGFCLYDLFMASRTL